MLASNQSVVPNTYSPLDTMLLHELNHRIGNVFQLATSALEVAAGRAEGTTELVLRQAACQLRGHATVHRLLGGMEPELVDGGAFLADLCEAMQQALPPDRRVNIDVAAGIIVMPAAQGQLLGILVHELILNAVKHAFGPMGGRIVVALEESDRQIRCSVADNGLGLRETDPVRRGLGMTLVEHLAQHAGATCSWRIGSDGTLATITVDRSMPAGPSLERGPAPDSGILKIFQRSTKRHSRLGSI